MKTIRFLALLTVILVMPHLYPTVAYGDDATYAITVVKVDVSALESATIYGTLKLKVPKYLVVDKENEIHAIFERSGGCWDGISVIFYITARVNISSSSTRDYDLGAVSFSLGCGSPIQEGTVKIVIPRAVYDASIDKRVSIHVSKVDISKPLVVSAKASIVSNIPATAHLVTSLPEPVLRVLNLEKGYLDLKIGEVQSLVVEITSYYAPTLISDIDVYVPSFVSAYLDIPLPLTIGANQSIQVPLRFEGVSPGAGVTKIAVTYVVGDTTKRINIYVPVVVSSSELDTLIEKYKQSIEQYKQMISELEGELKIKIEDLKNITERIDRVLTMLQLLAKQYEEALTSINMLNETLTNKVLVLEERLNTLDHLSKTLLNATSSIEDRVNKAFMEIEKEIERLNLAIRQLSEESLNSLQRELEMLRSMLFLAIILAVIAIAVAILAVRRRL